MSNITDNDLILLYYGEHEDPELARRVAEDPRLRARLDALGRELEPLDRFPVPEPDAEFGARTWHRISTRIGPRENTRRGNWLDALVTPRFSFVGVFVIVLVAGLAFWLGRESGSTAPAGVASGETFRIDSSRLLATRIEEHLSEADILLTGLVNEGSGDQRESDWAAAMLISNRIYARAAEAAGQDQLAQLLREMEPVLIEIANQPERAAPVDDSLLFRIRTQARHFDQHKPI